MVDEPATRVKAISARIENLERTFEAAVIDVTDPESRARFGEDHRKLREILDRRERRNKWMTTAAATVFAGIVTAMVVSGGPTIWKIITQILASGR